MGRVVDLERTKVEALARALMPALRDRGSIAADVAGLEDVERWRRAARRAGRLLGWRVRTGVTADGAQVRAASDDWPVPPGAHRHAALRVSSALGLTHRPRRRRRP